MYLESSQEAFKLTLCARPLRNTPLNTGQQKYLQYLFFGSLPPKQDLNLAVSEMGLKGLAADNDVVGWFSCRPFKASEQYLLGFISRETLHVKCRQRPFN